jgi:hypothetical protein
MEQVEFDLRIQEEQIVQQRRVRVGDKIPVARVKPSSPW